MKRYALTRTGLFHLIGDPGWTLCELPVCRDTGLPVMPDIWEVTDEYAETWLAANPNDLCHRCKSDGGR